ncbi:MAG: MaoC family dehydratase N-terminal domain-containing protein [Pseudolabrys sp.]
MANAPITPAEIESYQAHVGRTLREIDVVGAHLAARMAATLDRPLPEHDLPAMWHHGLFQPSAPTLTLGHDGHPRRGGFLPPVSLPRRMFAGSDMRCLRRLRIGEEVTRDSRVLSVQHRQGRSGDLVFVRVARTLSQAGIACIEEEQAIVYRGAGVPTPPVTPKPPAPLTAGETARAWTPNTVELFRYSAAIFVAHRIHYDWNYVTQEEGYPGIIVHGPLTATRLCEFAEDVGQRNVTRFSFRGEAPLFADQEIRLVGRMDGAERALRAERADGVTAMSATAEFG